MLLQQLPETTIMFVLLLCVGQLALALDCGNEEDCIASDHPICVLDKEDVCFTRFESECHMELYSCTLKKEFMVYADAFCDLSAFMCPTEYQSYVKSWSETENINDTIYNIYQPAEKNDSNGIL